MERTSLPFMDSSRRMVGSKEGADCITTELCDLGKPLTLFVPPKL